jgi:pimeloyl-ACP methyl ester carboxylesterase
MKARSGEAGIPFSRRALVLGGAGAAAAALVTKSVAAAAFVTTGDGAAARTSGVTPVGGIPIYFEVHGGPLSARTTPFVLLHGGLMTIETAFAGDLLPRLSAIAPTIAIESQGHGHTADRPGPMKLDLLVADVIGVLDHLRVDSAHFLGHSLGALTAVELVMRHPARAKSVTSLSGVYDINGQIPELISLQRDPARKPSDALARILPAAQDIAAWTASFERSGADVSRMPDLGNRINQMRDRWQRWTPAQLGSIGVPALLGIGDRDFTRVDHAAEMATLIPNARLAVLPGTTHAGMISRGAWLVPMIQSLINA